MTSQLFYSLGILLLVAFLFGVDGTYGLNGLIGSLAVILFGGTCILLGVAGYHAWKERGRK